jgi:hypothetical protein
MDATMCKGKGCPVAYRCHRHTAKPSMMQSWFAETPGAYEPLVALSGIIGKQWTCEFYQRREYDQVRV